MIAGVVADDPTGATDTGHELAARGLRTLASASGTATGEAPGPVDVHVVDADSRYVDPEEATTAVARVIDGRDHPFVYKKTDSTLGGDLVAEVDAALDAVGADAVTSDLRAAARGGRTIVVADASHERYLDALATGAARSDGLVLHVGGAGLARYVEAPSPAPGGSPLRPDPEAERPLRRREHEPGHARAGRRAPLGAGGPLDLGSAIDDPGAVTACSGRIKDRGVAALVSAPDDDAPTRAFEAGRRHGLDGSTVRSRIAEAMGGTVARLWRGHSAGPFRSGFA